MIADLRPSADGALPQAARLAGLRVETNSAIVGSYGTRRVTHALIAKRWADGAPSAGEAIRLRLHRDERRLDGERRAARAGARAHRLRRDGAMLPAGEPGRRAAARPAPAAAPSGSPTRSPTASPPAPRRSAKRRRSRRGSKARRPLRAARWRWRSAGRPSAPARRSSTSTTTSPRATSRSPRARACARSNTSSATPPPAWAPTRARRPISTRWRSPPNALGKPIAEVGLTTFRPPYAPVTFGAFAGLSRGDLFEPIRETPLHGWAARKGAVFEDAGQWKRASRFPLPGETAAGDAQARVPGDARQRGRSGRFDARQDRGRRPRRGRRSSSASMSMRSPSSPVGRCRYALMLSEDGYVIDDGVVMRLAEDRFHVTTTTGGAGRVFALMEDYRQTEWPDLKVWATSITEQYATIAINGPKAREILAPLAEGIDLSPAAFPHMSVREGRVAGGAGAAGAGQLHRRSRVRGQRSRRLSARACWRRSGPRARRSARSPTGSTRCTCCAPRRAT